MIGMEPRMQAEKEQPEGWRKPGILCPGTEGGVVSRPAAAE